MKVITLRVVVKDEMAEATSKEFEKAQIAQEGLYTLECGSISDITEEEKKEVLSQVPEEYLED